MPSEKVLESKKAIVAQLTERFQNAQAGVLADYRGLTVAQDTELRSKMREAGVEYTVLKNNLVRFAAKNVGLDDLDPILHGPTAIATSADDVVAPAKVLVEFAKENDTLELKGGFVDGKVISVEDNDMMGTTVQIKHDNNLISVYQSLSNVKVKVDDTVIQGQVIAQSGESNINKDLGNHLHFELYYKGEIVNPEEFYNKSVEEF